MSTILTHAIIQKATAAVDTYISTAGEIFSELEGIISTLVGNNFIGDASNGYSDFYKGKVVPALTQNLTDPSNSLTASIKNILESIETQLLNTVDPELGENNRNPGVAE